MEESAVKEQDLMEMTWLTSGKLIPGLLHNGDGLIFRLFKFMGTEKELEEK